VCSEEKWRRTKRRKKTRVVLMGTTTHLTSEGAEGEALHSGLTLLEHLEKKHQYWLELHENL
jgi:4-hydroxy-3-methylbut-2-enyl diphosphate reductase IspH